MSNSIIDSNKIIRVNRGDSLLIPLNLQHVHGLHKEPYVLQEGDKLYFGVMLPNTLWEESYIKKVFTPADIVDEDGKIILKLNSSDTEFMLPGTYYYSIKLLQSSGDVHTVQPKTLFYIE